MRRLMFLLLVVACLAASCSSKKNESDGGASTQTSTTLPVFTGAPPWPVADRQAERFAAAGLPALTAEGNVIHFHAHLDVIHNGEPSWFLRGSASISCSA